MEKQDDKDESPSKAGQRRALQQALDSNVAYQKEKAALKGRNDEESGEYDEKSTRERCAANMLAHNIGHQRAGRRK